MMEIIQLNAGKARLTDPCYDRSVSCNAVLDVLPGDWEVRVEEEGCYLLAHHLSYPADVTSPFWRDMPEAEDLGVDSGQIGIFADELFPEEPGDYEEGTFYMAACHAGEEPEGGIVKFEDKVVGYCVATCYGDGTYKAQVRTNVDGIITAICIGLE
jgi:hypothetical protein